MSPENQKIEKYGRPACHTMSIFCSKLLDNFTESKAVLEQLTNYTSQHKVPLKCNVALAKLQVSKKAN